MLIYAKAGYFSSDRTIEEYNRDIWKLLKIYMKYIEIKNRKMVGYKTFLRYFFIAYLSEK